MGIKSNSPTKSSVEWDTAIDGFVGDGRIGHSHLAVPGPDGKRGFGGKCLPKDIRAFSTVYESDLLKEIIVYNDSLRNDLDKFLMNYKD